MSKKMLLPVGIVVLIIGVVILLLTIGGILVKFLKKDQ